MRYITSAVGTASSDMMMMMMMMVIITVVIEPECSTQLIRKPTIW